MATETRPYQILLAEDSAADVGIVRIALRDQGLDHVLHVARDGEEAISFIQNADKDSKSAGPGSALAGHASAQVQRRGSPQMPEVN